MGRNPRLRLALATLLAVTASCDGGSDPPPEPPPAVPAGQPFTLSGTVTYDFVRATLDPASSPLVFTGPGTGPRPVRNARLQVRQGSAGTVLSEVTTDESGRYTITFTPGPRGALTVAALAETTTPPIRVEDNTDGNALWAVGRPIVDASPTLDVHATHGWNGSGYVAANRIAAPFAILDSMYTAARRIIDIPRAVSFPELRVNWSPDNRNVSGNKAAGDIGTSHYDGSEIYVLGFAGVDTDEFDSHVIVHEWGHYFEEKLSRSDSPGGSHSAGDLLDPRLAFGEGYGNAIAAMLLPESIYVDTGWIGGTLQVIVGFDAEPQASDDPNRGPFSEDTVMRVLYDLYDDANEPGDTLTLGLGPIYDTLVGPQKNTDSLTTIASFITGLKAQPGVNLGGVDDVLATHGIGPITDAFGAGDVRLGDMFRRVAIGSTSAVTLAGGWDGQLPANKWQWIQYFVASGTGGQLAVTAFSTSDVGLEAYRAGTRITGADQFGGNATETIRFGSLNGETYVIVLTGFEQQSITYDVTVSVTSP